MTKHFSGNISNRFLIRDLETNDVLVTRDPNDEIFEIPGGRVDEGESLDVNLIREAKEELGIDLDLKNITYIYSEQSMHIRDQRMQAYIVFTVDIDSKADLDLKLSDEVAEFVWISKVNFNDMKYYDCAKRALDVYFKNN